MQFPITALRKHFKFRQRLMAISLPQTADRKCRKMSRETTHCSSRDSCSRGRTGASQLWSKGKSATGNLPVQFPKLTLRLCAELSFFRWFCQMIDDISKFNEINSPCKYWMPILIQSKQCRHAGKLAKCYQLLQTFRISLYPIRAMLSERQSRKIPSTLQTITKGWSLIKGPSRWMFVCCALRPSSRPSHVRGTMLESNSST
jgi:hypothetical protein